MSDPPIKCINDWLALISNLIKTVQLFERGTDWLRFHWDVHVYGGSVTKQNNEK